MKTPLFFSAIFFVLFLVLSTPTYANDNFFVQKIGLASFLKKNTIRPKIIFGKITSISDNEIIINIGQQKKTKAIISGTTSVTDRKGKKIGIFDMSKGERVSVKGILSNKKEFGETLEIKNYSLPVIPKKKLPLYSLFKSH